MLLAQSAGLKMQKTEAINRCLKAFYNYYTYYSINNNATDITILSIFK